MARRESRTDERKGFQVPVRVQLLEGDMDAHEDHVSAELANFRAKLDRFQGILIGILVTLTTASVLLALNLIAESGP